MKILLYGGSFNPFHNGHKSLLIKTINFLSFDEIWIIPNSIEKDQRFMSDENRIKIIKNDLKKIKNLKILNIELNNPEPVKTIDTINKIVNSDHKFYFLLGSDQIIDLKSWEDFKIMKSKVKFIWGLREGYVCQDQEELKDYIKIPSLIKKSSSTEIRKGHLKNVSPFCLNFLQSNLDYLALVVKNNTNQERYNHSLDVAKKARELALKFLPKKANKAYISGLLHDICKTKSKSVLKELIGLDSPWISRNQNTWHQVAGANFVSKALRIDDVEIINSIKKHTTADLEMSDFEKIIYVADKISKDRTYPQVYNFRELCDNNLNICFKSVFEFQLRLVEKKFGLEQYNILIRKKLLNEIK